MFSEMLQMLRAKPLVARKLGKCALKRGGSLCWAEFGEIDRDKVKHTVLYFHGAPGCKFEPALHSCTSYDKRLRFDDATITSNPDDFQNTDTSGASSDISTEELDVYKKRGIRLICIERPGFGNSAFSADRTVADFVDDVIEVTNNSDINIRSIGSYGISKFSADTAGHKSICIASTGNESQMDISGCTSSGIKDDKIYVIGYSAGGPYALAMRALFEKKQLQLLADSQSRRSLHDDTESSDQTQDGSNGIIRIAAVSVIASSVGPADNIEYRSSVEGRVLDAFFRLPTILQACLYSGGINSILIGLNVSIYCLSSLKTLQKMYHQNVGSASKTDNSDTSIDNMIPKLRAIEDVISQSISKYGGQAMVSDTLATQFLDRPWGFCLTPTRDETPPPIFFFYSKEDQTVPPESGVFLCERTMGGGVPIWLSGGHSCFILHLDTILDKMIENK